MEGHSVRGVRYPACGSAISVLILASPGIALLMLVVVEMPIDLLMNLVALALLCLTTVGALGWFVLQRQAALSNEALSSEPARVRAPPNWG
jgi:membrane protein DedA with SNARE-associated domain